MGGSASGSVRLRRCCGSSGFRWQRSKNEFPEALTGLRWPRAGSPGRGRPRRRSPARGRSPGGLPYRRDWPVASLPLLRIPSKGMVERCSRMAKGETKRPRRSLSTWDWWISGRSTCWSRKASTPTAPTSSARPSAPSSPPGATRSRRQRRGEPSPWAAVTTPTRPGGNPRHRADDPHPVLGLASIGADVSPSWPWPRLPRWRYSAPSVPPLQSRPPWRPAPPKPS